MLLLFIFLFYILLTLFARSVITPMPISDTGSVRYRTIPWVTLTLILINAVVFIGWQAANLYQGAQLVAEGDFSGYDLVYDYVRQIWTYGYRGIFLRDGLSIGAFTTFTSMFMHGDLWHLLGNMIYLWAFGRRVEDACGPWRYLVFYLLAGMVANIGSDVLNRAQADLPGIGASGAISGVMGAYLILFPGAMVTCIWGIGMVLRLPIVIILKLAGVRSVRDARIWRWTIRLPAWTLLLFFLASNFLPSLDVLTQGQDYGGVNTLAHVTGFLAALVIFLFVRKDLLTRYIAGRSL
ncbi:MAG: rhomboid family intramembrane serine protease [Chloroflexi bacterium]|nr:rhomboid family intramembrane serine protease [Chloroflexota bacterium]